MASSQKERYGIVEVMYVVNYAQIRPDLNLLWSGAEWAQAETLEINRFLPESTFHYPHAQAKLLYDERGIYGIFRVEDRFVLCLHAGCQSPVYEDSCVEFFVKPNQGVGYFNFEFNCGGALLSSYITDHRRTPHGFRSFRLLSGEDCRSVRIGHSLPEMVYPEIDSPVEWFLEFFIPFELFERYIESFEAPSAGSWKANFFKCGDRTSHPHWASWQPLPEKNFHSPEYFGDICFCGRT